jgi:hypothetical protein
MHARALFAPDVPHEIGSTNPLPPDMGYLHMCEDQPPPLLAGEGWGGVTLLL